MAVSGRVCRDPLRRFPPGAPLALSGRAPPPARERIVLALNKTRGTVTTERDPEGRPTVFGLLPPGLPRVVAVGRLDRATRGLLLFTNDTALADRLTDPERHVPKTYHVHVDRVLPPEALRRLASGAALADGTRTRPCKARLLRSGGKTCWLEIILTEGLNRQVRRMVESAGGRVLDLVRVSIGTLALGALKPGESRRLSAAEVRAL